jgi:hypothetical protein
MIDGAPRIGHLAVELDVHLVEMPTSVVEAAHPAHSLPANIIREQCPEPVPPVPHGFVAKIDPALDSSASFAPLALQNPHSL